MKKYWKAMGIAAVAAGVLYYPAMRLYKYLKAQKNDDGAEEDHHIIKQFSPAYRGGKHKHNHHRQAPGQPEKGTGLA